MAKKDYSLTDRPFKHGILSGYVWHGCTCTKCMNTYRKAQTKAATMRAHNDALRIKLGH